MTRLSILIVCLFTVSFSYGQDLKQIKKSIPLKGVKSILPYSAEYPGHYYFINKQGDRGLWDQSNQKLIIGFKDDLVAIPTEFEDVWFFATKNHFILKSKDGEIEWAKGFKNISQKMQHEKAGFRSINGRSGYSIIQRERGKYLDCITHNKQVALVYRDTNWTYNYSIIDQATGNVIVADSGRIEPLENGYMEITKRSYDYTFSYMSCPPNASGPKDLKSVFKDVKIKEIGEKEVNLILGDLGKVAGPFGYRKFLFKGAKLGLFSIEPDANIGVILAPEYDVIQDVNWMQTLISKNGKCGLLSEGNIVSVPTKRNWIEIIGANTCESYVNADSVLYEILTWDCEMFEGLSQINWTRYDSLKNLQKSSIRVVNEHIILTHGNIESQYELGEMDEELIWDKYTGNSGVYDLKNNSWIIQPNKFSIEPFGNGYVVANILEKDQGLLYKIYTRNWQEVKNVSYSDKITHSGINIYGNSEGHYFKIDDVGNQVKFGEYTDPQLDFLKGFMKITDYGEGGLAYHNEMMWNEAPDYKGPIIEIYNSKLQRLNIPSEEVKEFLDNDLLLRSKYMPLEESDFGGYEVAIYDARTNKNLTPFSNKYSFEDKGNIYIGDELYNLRTIRSKLPIIKKLEIIPELDPENFISASIKVYDNKEAKIIAEIFVDKGGREHPEIVEYYLEFGGKQHWIKFADSKVSVEAVKALAGQTIYFDGKLENGLWDTDNPEVQSRIGEFLIVDNMRK